MVEADGELEEYQCACGEMIIKQFKEHHVCPVEGIDPQDLEEMM